MLCVMHVRVEDHFAVEVAGGAAGGLDEAGGAAQIALLVGVENGHQRDLGQVEALAQQVDADQHVELAFAQGAQDFHALDGVNLAVQVLDVDADLAQVIGQFLGGALGQGGHQHALLGVGPLAAFVDQVVDLARERLDGDLGVHQAGGPDDLLDDAALWTIRVRAGSGVALT